MSIDKFRWKTVTKMEMYVLAGPVLWARSKVYAVYKTSHDICRSRLSTLLAGAWSCYTCNTVCCCCTTYVYRYTLLLQFWLFFWCIGFYVSKLATQRALTFPYPKFFASPGQYVALFQSLSQVSWLSRIDSLWQLFDFFLCFCR